MRCVLTGATGFVGGVLARQLRARGHEVVALVRDPVKATYLADIGVQLVPGDLADVGSLDALCEGAEALFHVAGWYKVGERDQSVGTRINVEGTRNVLAAAQRAAVPRTVYTSTLAVNSDTHGEIHDETYRHQGPYVSQYDRTKAEAHSIAEQFAADGLPLVIVQPGMIYGPGDTSQTGDLIAQVVRGRRPQVPSSGKLCWAHVDDVAAGHILALEYGREGESYMLAGPILSIVDGLRLVASIAGTPGPIVVPAGMVRGAAVVMDVLGRLLPLPPMLAAESMRAGMATYLGNPAKAEHELGWTARTPETGLRETVDALRR